MARRYDTLFYTCFLDKEPAVLHDDKEMTHSQVITLRIVIFLHVHIALHRQGVSIHSVSLCAETYNYIDILYLCCGLIIMNDTLFYYGDSTDGNRRSIKNFLKLGPGYNYVMSLTKMK